MKRILLSLVLLATLTNIASAQHVTVKNVTEEKTEVVKKDTCYWNHKGNVGFNLSQSAYVNWSAGGQNASKPTTRLS